MNKFIIRHIWNHPIEEIARHGIVKLDAKLWRDQVILETDLTFEEVKQLPFVLAIKNITD